MLPNGAMSADLYNSFGAMHGTIMVFLAIVPLAFAAFGNYVVPLMIGAPDMAFPRINMASYQAFVLGGVIMLVSFFIPGGAAQAGWTSYPPLAAVIPTHGQTFWIVGMVFLITSSLLGCGEFHRHHHPVARAGHDLDADALLRLGPIRDRVSVAAGVSALGSGGVMQLMDKVAGTSFFLPTGLMVSGQSVHISGGGSPLLWQHLFWFLGTSGSLRFDSAGHGNRERNHREQHAQAALGLPFAGLFRARDRFSLLHRLGAPHVFDRAWARPSALFSRRRR